MSTTVITPQATEAPVFDAKAHIEAKMTGKTPPVVQARAEEAKPAVEAPKPAVEPAPESKKADSSRSQRRALRAAEERTLGTVLKVLKESGVLPEKKADEAKPEVVEPKRADFAAGDEGTAAFLRATQKFDKEQEARTAEEKQAEQEALRAHYEELDAKAKADIESNFPDWDDLAKKWAENEDIKDIKYDDIPVIMGLLANSDLRAALNYHWMKNPDEFLELVEMPQDKQIRAFHRLEGRLEKEYSTKKPAQGSEPEKGKEDRKHLAEAEKPGEPQREVPVKPKPSSVVVARGGSPPPDAPPIGSAAWMAQRNQKLYGR